MEKNFSFKDVPRGYQLCFNESCPLHSQCIRYLAGQHVPAHLEWGPAIYPTAIKDGSCKWYKKTNIVMGAYGFLSLFRDVKEKDAPTIRKRLTRYLGGNGNYYRYMHGDKLLTPRQQEGVLNIFREYGYTERLVFDGVSAIYDFS